MAKLLKTPNSGLARGTLWQTWQNPKNSGFQGVPEQTLGQTAESLNLDHVFDTEKWCFSWFLPLFRVFPGISTLGADNFIPLILSHSDTKVAKSGLKVALLYQK